MAISYLCNSKMDILIYEVVDGFFKAEDETNERCFECADSRFAVNCGGRSITSNDGIEYEADSEALGPATYYTSSTRRWAVSNAGLAVDNNAPEYISSTASQFTNTLDSELFQNVRLSAGDLRYYGLGLQNGNYTVRLQFAETINPAARTWQAVQRRVFDIYVQVCVSHLLSPTAFVHAHY